MKAKVTRRKAKIRLASCILSAVLLITSTVKAQELSKLPRIGLITSNRPGSDAFRQGLHELGMHERENIVLEYRNAEGTMDRVSLLVTELLELKVNVLVVTILPGILRAKEATKTVPIVMVTTLDPVAAGIVRSLAHPGGNITGVTRLTRQIGGKRLELLSEIFPGLSHVGILRDMDDPASPIAFKEYETAAGALRMQIQSLEVRGSNPNLEGAFQGARKAHSGAIVAITNPLIGHFQNVLIDLATKYQTAVMYEARDYVEAGGLISYSANEADSFRRAATYVDKILKGAKPADLPLEQPTKFELVINLRTAKQIGLTIPPNVLARADRVIR